MDHTQGEGDDIFGEPAAAAERARDRAGSHGREVRSGGGVDGLLRYGKRLIGEAAEVLDLA